MTAVLSLSEEAGAGLPGEQGPQDPADRGAGRPRRRGQVAEEWTRDPDERQVRWMGWGWGQVQELRDRGGSQPALPASRCLCSLSLLVPALSVSPHVLLSGSNFQSFCFRSLFLSFFSSPSPPLSGFCSPGCSRDPFCSTASKAGSWREGLGGGARDPNRGLDGAPRAQEASVAEPPSPAAPGPGTSSSLWGPSAR